jgi:hypothetical protein
MAKRNYEILIRQEVKELPLSDLPQIFKLLKGMNSKEETIQSTGKRRQPTGFCGIWKDGRTPGEIVADLRASRTGLLRRHSAQ